MATWYIVPARGGSRGVPRKNVRLLNGRPLMTYAIDTILEVGGVRTCVVVTDDDEIADIALTHGVQVFREPTTTGKATLDEVVIRTVPFLESLGASNDDLVLTVQATCPFIRAVTIQSAIRALGKGAGSVLSVTEERHLAWRKDGEKFVPDYTARLNRQLLPPRYRETGGVIGARLGAIKKCGTRIVAPTVPIVVDENEALDIDDFKDWSIAEYLATRKRIFIRADANRNRGMGHVYRGLALAQELAGQEVSFFVEGEDSLAFEFLSQYPFKVRAISDEKDFIRICRDEQPDLVILDTLDSEIEFVRDLKAAYSRLKIVSFEDLGTGAEAVDLVVNDLYQNIRIPRERQFFGISNSILAPAFESNAITPEFKESIQKILIVFGGTDPLNLTEKALEALSALRFEGQVSVVQGYGRADRVVDLDKYRLKGQAFTDVKYMPALMREVDLAISSGGRTITELMQFGIPTICICQNEKELSHTHASFQYGVLNLGLGDLVDLETLSNHIKRALDSVSLRRLMRERALFEIQGRSNAKIVKRIWDYLFD